jgi:hypothetical protein
MAIKASRREMFRGMFGRAGFELHIETAHEILVRLNRLLDPIPVSVPMWDSYLAARRPLRYADFRRSHATDRASIALELEQAAAHADFSRFSDVVANDLGLLLRVEILLRMWTSSATAAEGVTTADPRRREIAQILHGELLSYLHRLETDEAASQALADEVAKYVLKEAARPGATR